MLNWKKTHWKTVMYIYTHTSSGFSTAITSKYPIVRKGDFPVPNCVIQPCFRDTENVYFTRVKRSLSVVNFKPRIASFAWRASSSAFAQRTRPSCIQHCLPLNAWRASRPTFAVRGYPSAAFYAAEVVTCATTLRVTPGSAPSTSPTGGAKDQWRALRCEAW